MELIKDFEQSVKQEHGFIHSKILSLPPGNIDPIIDWCKQELTPGWKWQIITSSTPKTPGEYAFFFYKESDFFAFILKYG